MVDFKIDISDKSKNRNQNAYPMCICLILYIGDDHCLIHDDKFHWRTSWYRTLTATGKLALGKMPKWFLRFFHVVGNKTHMIDQEVLTLASSMVTIELKIKISEQKLNIDDSLLVAPPPTTTQLQCARWKSEKRKL